MDKSLGGEELHQLITLLDAMPTALDQLVPIDIRLAVRVYRPTWRAESWSEKASGYRLTVPRNPASLQTLSSSAVAKP